MENNRKLTLKRRNLEYDYKYRPKTKGFLYNDMFTPRNTDCVRVTNGIDS